MVNLKELSIEDCYYLLHYNQPVDLSFIYNADPSLLSLDDFYNKNYKDLELSSNILDVIKLYFYIKVSFSYGFPAPRCREIRLKSLLLIKS